MWIKLKNIIPDGKTTSSFYIGCVQRRLVAMTTNELNSGRRYGYAEAGKQGASWNAPSRMSDVEPMAWVAWAVMEMYEKGLVYYSEDVSE